MDPKKKSITKNKQYMKKAVFFILSVLVLALSSCQQNASQKQPAGQNLTGSSKDSVAVVQLSKSAQADTLYVDLKILDPQGNKVFYNTLDKSSVTVTENGLSDPNRCRKWIL